MADAQVLSEYERMHWAAWASLPQVGPQRFARLRGTFRDLAHAWSASESALRACLGEGKTVNTLLESKRALNVNANWQRIVEAGIRIVTIVDAEYPPLLRETHNAPVVLFVRGTLPQSDQQLLAVVGTRVATPYGRTVVERLVPPLVRAGLGIVSGLALGIDGYAHEAALTADGKTYAVVGTGLDQVYPPQHAALAERIVKTGGAIISEFPLGTKPLPQHFPLRNRIVAGMCAGTLVIEAGEKSGALLTAKLALDENRDVFCVPGDVTRETSTGTNKFIRLGATLVGSAEDILTALNVDLVSPAQAMAPAYAGANPDEQRVLAHLSSEPRHVDELSTLCDCDPSVITATLAVLELQGHVRHTGGMHYVKNE